MRVISFNANGIRSAAKKGFFTWLGQQHADFVCIQETKAQRHQLQSEAHFCPEGYFCDYVDAQKKGYSGVALYCMRKKSHLILRPTLGLQRVITKDVISNLIMPI